MAEILLEAKGGIGIMIEAEVINPEILEGKSRDEIERLSVWQGPVQVPLSEFFDVSVREDGGPDGTLIRVEGDLSRVKHIGHGMRSGQIEIAGPAGMHLGSEMAGGSILLRGSAGSWAGMEMKGGVLHIMGDAGDHVGCAYRGSWRGMTGGKILIDGDARSQLGGGMAGGEILVRGDVENFCGIRQSGGALVVCGRALRGAGAEMTGGTIAVCGGIRQFTPGFVEAGFEDSPNVGGQMLAGRFDKFSGDYAVSKNPKGVLYVAGGR